MLKALMSAWKMYNIIIINEINNNNKNSTTFFCHSLYLKTNQPFLSSSRKRLTEFLLKLNQMNLITSK